MQDEERRHSMDEARAEFERLQRTYPALGYAASRLPKIRVAQRADFEAGHLGQPLTYQGELYRISPPRRTHAQISCNSEIRRFGWYNIEQPIRIDQQIPMQPSGLARPGDFQIQMFAAVVLSMQPQFLKALQSTANPASCPAVPACRHEGALDVGAGTHPPDQVGRVIHGMHERFCVVDDEPARSKFPLSATS